MTDPRLVNGVYRGITDPDWYERIHDIADAYDAQAKMFRGCRALWRMRRADELRAIAVIPMAATDD